jgi:2-polyprenyl-3-methyl-5-hydroxy-6-metoxy-1,4-benzoquinol methylase
MIYCLICKNNDVEKITINNKLYYYCKKCNFIYLQKSFIVNNVIEKNRYLMHNNNNNTGYEEMFNKFINKNIINNIPKGKKILDYGCGFNPLLSKILIKKGYNVDFYDKYFFKKKIYLANKYDLITVTEVIEHLYNPLKYFELFNKLLNNESIIAGMTLFHPDNKELFLKWWYKNDITHISFYTEKTIEYIADILNFSLLYIDKKNTFILKKN